MEKLMQFVLAVVFPPFGWVYVWRRTRRREGIEDMGVMEMPDVGTPDNPMGMPEIDLWGSFKVRFWSRFMGLVTILSTGVWWVIIVS